MAIGVEPAGPTAQLGWSDLWYSGVERSGVERSGLEWSGVERSGVERSGVERSGVESSHGTSGAPAGLGLVEPETPLHDVTFVVVDVETTGGSPNSSSLTEVAAARYRGGELCGTFRTFVRAGQPISPFVTGLTGITDAMVATAPPADAVVLALIEFIGRSVIVGHNLRFDLAFLERALDPAPLRGVDMIRNPTVDTLDMARRLVGPDLPNCRLGTLAEGLRLAHRPTHRALDDVLATGDLLHALLERAGTFGIVDLGELLCLPALLGHPQARKLRVTAALPRQPGLFWFTDPRGRVLVVDRARDVRAGARARFLVERDRRNHRLLRQMHGVGHHFLSDERSATAMQRILLDRWKPPFNRPAVRAGRNRRAGGRRTTTPAGARLERDRGG